MVKVRTFVSMDYFTCNVFVCTTDNGSFLVDPGYFDEKIKNYIDSIGGIKFVLITHGHYDHIGGLDDLLKAYPSLKAYAYYEENDVIYSNRKNMAFSVNDRDTSFKKYVPVSEVTSLQEGNIELEGIALKVIHTPGHTHGGAMYYLEKENIIFMGDTIICESIGRYDLPTANENELYASLAKVKTLGLKKDTKCYFGHGYMMEYGILQERNMALKQA